MTITITQLSKIAIYLKEPKLSVFTAALNKAMDKFKISTPNQQAAFLAQVMHESGECRYVKELASGEAYDTGSLAKRLGNTPEKDGDGELYKGRGLIQITGRDNYKAVGTALGFDAIANPALLEQPDNAALSAAWFWSKNNLNQYADGTDSGFLTITKRINGGTNGLDDRRMYWAKAKGILCTQS